MRWKKLYIPCNSELGDRKDFRATRTRWVVSVARLIRLLYYLPMERMKKEIEKSEWEKEVVYNTIYLPVRFFKKEAYIRIDDYKEVRDKREKVVEWLEEENKKLNIKVASLEWEIKWLNSVIDKLKEENQTLELWLDRKEKLN